MYRKLELFGRIFILKSFILDKNVTGIRSTTQDKRHVLFLDCDDIDIDYLEIRLRALIERFRLSHIFLIQTNLNSYHAVCLDKFRFEEILHIQAWFNQEMEKHYMIFGIRRGYWVLRTSHKHKRDRPHLFRIILSRFNNREQSSAHMNVLNQYFNANMALANPDDFDEIIKENYPTVK